jgi:hypothetical protein
MNVTPAAWTARVSATSNRPQIQLSNEVALVIACHGLIPHRSGAGCEFEVTWRRSHRAGDVELGKLCRKKLVNELNDASATRACGNQGNAFLDRWQGIRDRYNQPANVTEGKVVFGIADPDAI